MRIKVAATLTLFFLLFTFSIFAPSAGAQRRRGNASRPNVSPTSTPSDPKIETSGGPKTETKAGRRTGDPAVLVNESLSTERKDEPSTPRTDNPSAQKLEGAATTSVKYVGVIPGGSGCPAGSGLIEIRMDSEDKNNANSSGGWIGATAQDKNITFKFCRVDGSQFSTPLNAPYAVLRLDGSCPAGSYAFKRIFNNETHKNNNSFSVDPSIGSIGIYPNTQLQNFIGHWFTNLHFCGFSPTANPKVGTPGTFPDLGVEYGVFAPSDLYGILEAGSLRSDDEDTWNMNSYSEGYYNNKPETSRIISDDINTDIQFAKVRSGPPIPNLHSVSLSVSSVKGGNNGKDPILTVALDGPAPPGGIRVDVSSSNTNIAWIHGNRYFIIPAGKTSEDWEYFLGTKNVLTNKSVTLTVKVNKIEGYVNLDIKK